ncbi:hypothetical protein Pyn_30103 [Prunus yedoensis var. nudiflora]|uniref:Uncharacterized protein n=1 Tax=Prunus yedoensis var. nudiflora TaxID=2094558 RepID=A0A314XU53_PRUYE|nr:hypothetical protein Pyn_30103 [Prunus yedoensis var. nudiflora]
MDPESLFEERSRISRPLISARAFGREPESVFLAMNNSSKLVHFANELGMDPDKALSERSTVTTFCSNPISGKGPLRKLLDKFRMVLKLGRFRISLGMVPLSKLFDKSMESNL